MFHVKPSQTPPNSQLQLVEDKLAHGLVSVAPALPSCAADHHQSMVGPKKPIVSTGFSGVVERGLPTAKHGKP
jgi:hypothetical protein